MTATTQKTTGVSVRVVRPHVVFDRAGGDISLPMPTRGSNTLLERCLLIAVARIVKARMIFEFGTYRGVTTKDLVRNVGGAHVYTLDLDPVSGAIEKHRDRSIGVELIRQHLPPTFSFGATALYGNSRTFDYSPYISKMDMVFVDGGHDYETVELDTAAALLMCREGGVIAWHDYDSPMFPDVAPAVAEAMRDYDAEIIKVEESRLAFWFSGGLNG